MRQLTELDIEKAAILKAYRAAIRLKYSMMADAEISRTLPVVEQQIEYARQSGDALQLDLAKVFSDNVDAV